MSKGQEVRLPNVKLDELLPATSDYVTYDGSLTQPGCQETVTWLLLNKPIYVSQRHVRGDVPLNYLCKRSRSTPVAFRTALYHWTWSVRCSSSAGASVIFIYSNLYYVRRRNKFMETGTLKAWLTHKNTRLDKHAEFDRYGCNGTKNCGPRVPPSMSLKSSKTSEGSIGYLWQPIVIYSNYGLFHTVVEIYGDLGRKHKFFIPPVWYPLYTSVQGLTVGTVRLIRLKQEWYPYPVVKKYCCYSQRAFV